MSMGYLSRNEWVWARIGARIERSMGWKKAGCSLRIFLVPWKWVLREKRGHNSQYAAVPEMRLEDWIWRGGKMKIRSLSTCFAGLLVSLPNFADEVLENACYSCGLKQRNDILQIGAERKGRGGHSRWSATDLGMKLENKIWRRRRSAVSLSASLTTVALGFCFVMEDRKGIDLTVWWGRSRKSYGMGNCNHNVL